MQLASWDAESTTMLGKCLGTQNSAEMSLDSSAVKRRPSQAQPRAERHQVVKPFPVATKKGIAISLAPIFQSSCWSF